MLVFYNRLHRVLLIVTLSFTVCLTGCRGWIPDPVCNNQTPPNPAALWKPAHFFPIVPCDCETEDELLQMSKDGKLNLANLIDIALQNNPTTQQTWALARAAAYAVQREKSRLYPSVNVQSNLIYQDFRLDEEPMIAAEAAAATAAAGQQVQTLSPLTALRQINDPNAPLGQNLTQTNSLGVGQNETQNALLGVNQIQSTLIGLNQNQTTDNVIVGLEGPQNVLIGPGQSQTQNNVLLTAGQLQAGELLIRQDQFNGPHNALETTQRQNGLIGPDQNQNDNIDGLGLDQTQNGLTPQNQTMTSGQTGIGSQLLLNNNVSVSYLLLDFGGRQASIEAAKQALYTSDWTHNRQIQQVMYSILDAYYTYQGLHYLIRARQTDIENARTNLNAAEQLFEAGIRSKLDVLQAETDYVNIQLNIIDLNGQERVTLNNLITFLGLPADSQLQIEDIPQNLPLATISSYVEGLIAKAKELRPDLAAAYANLQQRRAEVIVARSAGLPTLSADLNFENNIYFHNSSLNNRMFTGGISLNIPLFNGFFYTSETKRLQELVRAACADIRITELNVIADVLNSYANFVTAVESFRYSEEYFKISQETYQAALLTYREGISTILDLLSAQRTLANARAQHVQAKTRWAISLAQIAFAMGVLGTDDPGYGTTKAGRRR